MLLPLLSCVSCGDATSATGESVPPVSPFSISTLLVHGCQWEAGLRNSTFRGILFLTKWRCARRLQVQRHNYMYFGRIEAQAKSNMLNQHPQGANWLGLSNKRRSEEADSNSAYTHAPVIKVWALLRLLARAHRICHARAHVNPLPKDEATSELIEQI